MIQSHPLLTEKTASWYVNGVLINNFQFLTLDNIPSGDNEVKLIVTDNSNAIVEIIKNIYVPGNNPPIVDFNCTSTYIRSLSCYSSSSDPDSGDFIVEYIWQYDGKELNGSNSEFLTFSNNSLQLITLKVKDSFGAESMITKSFSILPNELPNVVVDESQFNPQSGTYDNIILDASGSTDADSQSLSYSWSTGDGKISTNPKLSHFYSEAGSYQIILTVSDGIDSVVRQFTVDVIDNSITSKGQITLSGIDTSKFNPSSLNLLFSIENSNFNTENIAINLDGNPIAQDLFSADPSNISLILDALADGPHEISLNAFDVDGKEISFGDSFWVGTSTLSISLSNSGLNSKVKLDFLDDNQISLVSNVSGNSVAFENVYLGNFLAMAYSDGILGASVVSKGTSEVLISTVSLVTHPDDGNDDFSKGIGNWSTEGGNLEVLTDTNGSKTLAFSTGSNEEAKLFRSVIKNSDKISYNYDSVLNLSDPDIEAIQIFYNRTLDSISYDYFDSRIDVNSGVPIGANQASMSIEISPNIDNTIDQITILRPKTKPVVRSIFNFFIPESYAILANVAHLEPFRLSDIYIKSFDVFDTDNIISDPEGTNKEPLKNLSVGSFPGSKYLYLDYSIFKGSNVKVDSLSLVFYKSNDVIVSTYETESNVFKDSDSIQLRESSSSNGTGVAYAKLCVTSDPEFHRTCKKLAGVRSFPLLKWFNETRRRYSNHYNCYVGSEACNDQYDFREINRVGGDSWISPHLESSLNILMTSLGSGVRIGDISNIHGGVFTFVRGTHIGHGIGVNFDIMTNNYNTIKKAPLKAIHVEDIVNIFSSKPKGINKLLVSLENSNEFKEKLATTCINGTYPLDMLVEGGNGHSSHYHLEYFVDDRKDSSYPIGELISSKATIVPGSFSNGKVNVEIEAIPSVSSTVAFDKIVFRVKGIINGAEEEFLINSTIGEKGILNLPIDSTFEIQTVGVKNYPIGATTYSRCASRIDSFNTTVSGPTAVITPDSNQVISEDNLTISLANSTTTNGADIIEYTWSTSTPGIELSSASGVSTNIKVLDFRPNYSSGASVTGCVIDENNKKSCANKIFTFYKFVEPSITNVKCDLSPEVSGVSHCQVSFDCGPAMSSLVCPSEGAAVYQTNLLKSGESATWGPDIITGYYIDPATGLQVTISAGGCTCTYTAP